MTNDSLNLEAWRATRWDCNNGDIEYHCYGPKDSFVVFNGLWAKKYCEIFMKSVGGALEE